MPGLGPADLQPGSARHVLWASAASGDPQMNGWVRVLEWGSQAHTHACHTHTHTAHAQDRC